MQMQTAGTARREEGKKVRTTTSFPVIQGVHYGYAVEPNGTAQSMELRTGAYMQSAVALKRRIAVR